MGCVVTYFCDGQKNSFWFEFRSSFNSPKVKRDFISSMKTLASELPHELSNDLKLEILEFKKY